MAFEGLSRSSLQQALLNTLGRMADLRKLSKQHRDQLSDIRSELAQLTHDLAAIEEQLERIVPFPAATTPANTDIAKIVDIRHRKKA